MPPVIEENLFTWALMAGLAAGFSAVCVYKPFLGACLLVCLHPLSAVFFKITQASSEQLILPYSLAVLIILPAALLRSTEPLIATAKRSPKPPTPGFPLVIYCMALFACWSFYSLTWSDRPWLSLSGLIRMLLNFAATLYLATFVRTLRQLKILFALVCVTACVFAAAAGLATHHANEWKIALPGSLKHGTLEFHAALFNQAGGFNPSVVGMLTGFGLGGKHEVGMLMLAGSICALYLATQVQSGVLRTLLLAIIVACFSIIFQAFVKITLVAAGLLAAATTLAFPSWRKRLPEVLLAFLLLNAAALVIANQLRTQHMKNMESMSSRLSQATESGRYSVGSMAERWHIWENTGRRIVDSHGLGRGADSLNFDKTFGYHHGHNIFLTLGAEYGLPGTALVFVMLASVLLRSWKLLHCYTIPSDLRLALLTATLLLMAALFEGLFDVYVWMPALWTMLGLLLAAMKITKPAAVQSSSSPVMSSSCTPSALPTTS